MAKKTSQKSTTPIVAAHISKDYFRTVTAEEQKAPFPQKTPPQKDAKKFALGSFNGREGKIITVGKTESETAEIRPTPRGTVRVIPLGGVEEYGKNMTVIESGDDIVVIDMGLMFPDEELLGVDYVIPDVTYLMERKHKIRGVILTHGHLDHIGALPYLYHKIGTPTLYGSPLSIEFAKKRLEEFGLLAGAQFATLNPIEDFVQLGVFRVHTFHINHSIPGALGLGIETPQGTLVYVTDWKFDHTPTDGIHTDFGTIAQMGKNGVLALFSDSTNVERPGHSVSEKEVEHVITDIIENAPGRVIFATFSSLISRIQQVLNAAEKTGRKVVFVGRSMVANVEVAISLKALLVPPNIIIDINEIKRLRDDQIIIVTTGSQGEEMSGLWRIAQGEHKLIKIKPGDTVIFSSSPIPGNEKSISGIMDGLAREGANVIYNKLVGVHTSGHANVEDLKLMIALTRPNYFIPIHGERHKLILHGKIAEGMGINPQNILIADNGQVIEFSHGRGVVTNNRVPAGYVLVDGLGVGDVGNIVLRDRKIMAQDGIFVVIATVDRQTGKLLTSPDIISKGFIYMRENEDLVQRARNEVKRFMENHSKGHLQHGPTDWSYVKTALRDELERFLFETTHRRPMVVPVVIEV